MLIRGTLGEQKTLVLVINGIDTVARVYDAFFADRLYSMTHFYRSCSQGRTWFTGDIVEIQMTMPTTCNYAEIGRIASEAAAAKGVNLDLYGRRAYIGPFPCPNYGLGALGQGSVTPGGTYYGQIWLKGLGHWTHEQGHGFGMAHANTYNPYLEYGDPTDDMGCGGMREICGPHKVQMGWHEPTALVDVNADGVYVIAPLEIRTTAPQILRIPKPGYPEEQYYVTYRQSIGDYDSFYPGFTSGASIHVWKPPETDFGGSPTRLVDTGPLAGFSDAPLVDGARWVENGLLIEQLGHSPGESGACTVRIAFGATPPPPPPPAPAFTISPSQATLRAGETLQFSASAPVDAWSLSGLGTLSATGFYRAPSPIQKKTSATVTASAGPRTASAVISLMKGR